MNNTPQHRPFAEQLLQQDKSLTESDYKEYRMELENALTIAKRREKICFHCVWMSLIVLIVLIPLGGSKIVGGFDPFDKNANLLSMGLMLILVLAEVTFPLALASYYTRFRQRVRDVREQLRDAQIESLQYEITELKKNFHSLARLTESK